MKKIISYLIAAMMLMTLIPATAFAGDSSCNHDWSEWEYDKTLTCIDQTAYRECIKCYDYEEKTILATTEHSWTEWYLNKSHYPCEDTYNYSFCDVCETKTKVIITKADEEHAWSEWKFEEDYACCERNGYRQCDECYEFEDKLFPAATEHNWSEWEAYCGEKIAHRFCIDCSEEDEKELTEEIPHNCVDWEIWDEATCTETGRKASYCEDCGELQEVEIPATGEHRWTKWYAAEGTSCMTGGEYIRYCESCGDAKETKPFKATGKHNWSGWLVWNEATVNSAGHLINYCKDCSVSKEQKINKIKTVKLSGTKFTYNGKAKKPVVTVKDTAGKKLVKGTDYTVKYKNSNGEVVTNPTKAGKYKAVIKFKGKYRNTVTKNFTINPKGTAIKTLKAGNDSFTAKWNKKTVQVNGYQIRYSTSAKFTKGTTKYTLVKGNKNTNKTVKNLKNNKKYYVQIRTYKNDNGIKVYSGWSKTKSVKTR